MSPRDVAQPKAKDLVDRINETKIMLPFFLGGKIADVCSTIYAVNKLGLGEEQNLWLRELMRENGSLMGNLIQSSLILPMWVLAAHGLNRLGDRFDLNFKIGNLIVYGLIGAEMYSQAILNLTFNYFR